jgi:hypothetical protein
MKPVSLWFFSLQTVYEWIASAAFREWCLFGAELLVALVIYLELSHSRSSNFLEKATEEEANQDRRDIYNQFLALQGDLQAMSKVFSDMIQTPEKSKLKHQCERQIALFSDLGFSSRKPMWSWHGRREDTLVSVLPHANIYIWVILKPYILKRRADTGPWHSAMFLRFTLRSVDFVLSYKRGLRFRMEDGEGGIEITVEELKAIRVDLKRLIHEESH